MSRSNCAGRVRAIGVQPPRAWTGAVLAAPGRLSCPAAALQNPLTGVANYAGVEGDRITDLALKYGACALGGWTPMVADLPRQFDRLLSIARDRGIGLDLHVDENGNPNEEVLGP